MKVFFVLVFSALSLFNLPAFADGMADMSGMRHGDGMADMPGMQHDGGMMPAADSTATGYHSQGIIKHWANRQVSIAHHAIAALHWPAMTMTFTVPDDLDAQQLAEGTPVDFSFRQDEQGYQLTAIHPIQQ